MSAVIVIVIVFDRRPYSILHFGEEQLFKERVDCKDLRIKKSVRSGWDGEESWRSLR